MKIVKNLFLVSLLILFAMPLYGAKRLTYYCSTDIPRNIRTAVVRQSFCTIEGHCKKDQQGY